MLSDRDILAPILDRGSIPARNVLKLTKGIPIFNVASLAQIGRPKQRENLSG